MIVFIFLFLGAFSTAWAGRVDLVFVEGSNLSCSTATVTLECTVSGDALIWSTPDGPIDFVRGETEDQSSYHGQLQELNSTHLRSTLTFTLTTVTTINCSDTSTTNSTTVTVEGPPSAPDRPLAGLDRIRRLNKTTSSVTVVWSIPRFNDAHISSYKVTVSPPISLPESGVIAADNLLFDTRQLTLTLQHGQQYDITVRARSCHDRVEGAVSSTLSIKVQVPPRVKRCTALPVYGYYSNNLKRIEIKWDPIPIISEDITDGITARVQNYTISAVPIGVAAPAINLTLEASNSSVCIADTCKVDFQSISNMTALYYSVHVTAKNLLIDGYSEGQVCSNTSIGLRNDLLSVDIERSDYSNVVEIVCRPLTRFKGTASCEVSYTTQPSGDVYTEISHSVGGAEDIISVVLITPDGSEAVLPVSAATRGGQQDVVVEGTLETGNKHPENNNVSDFLPSEEELMNQFCPENEMTDTITEESTTEVRTTTTKSTECPNTPWILAAVLFFVLLLIGFVSGVAVMVIWPKKRRPVEEEEEEDTSPVYEYITTSDIVLDSIRSNTPPELPKPRKK